MSGDTAVRRPPLPPHEDPPGAVEVDGKRWYVLEREDGGEPERYPSISTVAGILDDLMGWAGWAAMREAFDNLPLVVASTQLMPCGNTWSRCRHERGQRCEACPCYRCEDCLRRRVANRHEAISRKRADEGGQAHRAIQFWINQGGVWPAVDPDVEPYLASFRQFIADYGLTPESWLFSEATVVDREAGLVGTTDGGVTFRARASEKAADLVARVLGIPVLDAVDSDATAAGTVDYKSKEKDMEYKKEFYPSQVLQLTGYRHAPLMRPFRHQATEVPAPRTDFAAIVQLRLDGYVLRPMRTSPKEYAALTAAAKLATWAWTEAPNAYGVRAFPAPPKPEKTTTRRRAAKKATPAAATTGRPARTVADRIGATPRAAVPARIADANPFHLVTPPQPTTAAADGDGIPF